LRRALVLAFGLLLAIVAAELSYGTGHDNPTSQAISNIWVLPEATKSVAPPAGSVNQWVTVALGRPLFAPDRKPVAASGDAGLPRLTGVIASANDGVAIFQAAGKVHPVLVRRGETVSGWEVTMIVGDTVALRKAGDRLVIKPEFDNSKSSKVPQPRSRWEAAAPTGLLRARWANAQLQP
jgi:hypothetical protein